MKYVLTLIGKPATNPLDTATADRVARALTAAGAAAGAAVGAVVGPIDWLAPELACDLRFDGLAPAAAQSAARDALGGAPIDLVVQPLRWRRKRLLVADMDSTVIAVECIDELADFAGIRAEVAAITARTMRGELEFAVALRQRAKLLGGLDVALLQRAVDERIRLTPGARRLVATMRANGAYTALVSGGFTFFTGRVRELVGFDTDQANSLVIENSRLTGAVVEPILDRGAKRMALRRLQGGFRLPDEATLAVGDGANDIDMIEAAGLGVAFHAMPAVVAVADARIDHADLSALLYLQGYRIGEIVAPS